MQVAPPDHHGLCGFDQHSFTKVRDLHKKKGYREFTRSEILVFKTLFALERKAEYSDVNFGDYFDLSTYEDIGMTRGEHLFRLFSGEFRNKSGEHVYIYVVLRVEAKAGKSLAPKLFARSLPTPECHPGGWMNTREPWDYVDDSIFELALIPTTV